ncbi:hypothetical protein PZE06_23390 [Robertmurraya sp. DFI.2.37]|uniref:hypothetical protein n=1 Tax=Robertmurraya sp. DFI.2.37 TaxID=3031819 RepID=UPI001245EDBF|nr:hypothetical protein [Robertmurraya sp. DFI.2.37]MDF1511082.1 hypothetical protein [Robertmurraya sp. DFI.2.37]
MKTFIIWILVALMFTGLGALYAGTGWVIAWILDTGLDVNVNYKIFIFVAIGLYLLKIIPFMIVRLYAKKKEKEWEKDFKF